MELQPHGNNILVRRLRLVEPKVGSFHIADTIASKIPAQQGVVLRAGPRCKAVKSGMTIVWGVGTAIDIRDDLAFVNEKHVIGEVYKA